MLADEWRVLPEHDHSSGLRGVALAGIMRFCSWNSSALGLQLGELAELGQRRFVFPSRDRESAERGHRRLGGFYEFGLAEAEQVRAELANLD